MKSIPIHKLNDRVNIGLEIRHTTHIKLRHEKNLLGAHRDDHYIFFMMEEGAASMMIDFTEVEIKEKEIYYVLPGQVHHGIKSENGVGWFIAVDTALIPKEYRSVFEGPLLLQQPAYLEENRYKQCLTLIELLFELYNGNPQDVFYLQLVYSLLNSLVILAANEYSKSDYISKPASRPLQIAQEFKTLLNEKVKTEKQPSAYANYLNISEAYLNEVLKKVTGFSVTYWIMQEVMLEAKRLLYYSQLTVKEIAHQLGYEDHTYFSRLFKKNNEITPLAFRENYRK